jgi:hypothetical protein
MDRAQSKRCQPGANNHPVLLEKCRRTRRSGSYFQVKRMTVRFPMGSQRSDAESKDNFDSAFCFCHQFANRRWDLRSRHRRTQARSHPEMVLLAAGARAVLGEDRATRRARRFQCLRGRIADGVRDYGACRAPSQSVHFHSLARCHDGVCLRRGRRRVVAIVYPIHPRPILGDS